MKKSFSTRCLAFVLVTASLPVFFPVFAQKNQKALSRLPEAEPFKISRGSSFSASGADAKKSEAKSSKLSLPVISQDFAEALEIVRANHVAGKRVDYNALTKSALTASLRTLDPHSNYFDSAEFSELKSDQNSEYYGIGATIVNYETGGAAETFVLSTFPDSPASIAGLRFGDRIVAVGGEPVSGLSSSAVRDKVRGRKGTIARVAVERADTGKIETLEIRRNRVPQPSIPDAYLVSEGVGYIDLSQGFNYTTGAELDAALADLREQGMTALILDLRDNPGGILTQAVAVAEKFLPAGSTILTQKGRFDFENRVYKSKNNQPETVPLVVLVNGESASASEIVAGALQDCDRALIVGENTFGKGLVQSVINLPYGSGLTLTTAKYYTPSGRLIQRDYADGNLYDYYNHKTSAAEKEKTIQAARTLTGRKVFGGDGIAPDEKAAGEKLNETENRLLDPIFFFSRELAAGKIANFESYKAPHRIQYGRRISRSEFPLTEELFAAFKDFASRTGARKFSPREIESEKAFIKKRLRYNLGSAFYGNVAANQILIEQDPQVALALDALPRAYRLSLTASKTLSKQSPAR